MKRCSSYHTRKETRRLSDYERGVIYGKTGRRVETVTETIGVCWGVKYTAPCTCQGIEEYCDFYPEKRKENE